MSGTCRRCLRERFSLRRGLCWTCREPERRARSRREADRRRRAQRAPPPPPFRGVKGACALCGAAVPKGRFSWCSQACVDVWNLATSRDAQVAQLTALHGWSCWECGERTYDLEVDHARPLWSLTDDERTELRWWLAGNLQLLCRRHHRAKTAREAGQRARRRAAA